MPAWNELLNETNQAGSAHDIIRRRYLKQLHEHSNRNVILYYSGWLQKPGLPADMATLMGISDADKTGFMSAIHQLDRSLGLDLILHTPGGDLAATESIIDYLRSMFSGNMRAIVPQIAMSGGTIMALACSKIIMGKQSSIGPIDPQFGSVSAQALLDEFKKIRDEIREDPSCALLWEPILRKISPGFITECQNAVTWSKNMADRLLRTGMFKDAADVDKKVDEAISHLTEQTSTYNHGRHIGIDEARRIFGGSVEELEQDHEFQDLVLSVHHAVVITLQATNCYKMVENHTGRAFMQMVQIHPQA